MTKQDAQRISEHCQAQVTSDQFTPRLEAAYDVIANVPEYQNMTGVLIGLHGIKFASPTDTVIVSARTLAQLMLTALACGFAFGEDWGEGKVLESILANGIRITPRDPASKMKTEDGK
jgi:hypothetical protein